MKKSSIVAVTLALISLRPVLAGTEIVKDFSAEAPPPAPAYSYAPPPPPVVYYAPPPVRVVVRPAFVPVLPIFAFHRVARPRVYYAPRHW